MKKFIYVMLLSLSTPLLADWQLDPAQSKVYFVSTKKSHIAEVHHFKTFSGSIDKDGQATLTLPLSAVETNIGIRNERMQKLLFDVANHPSAQVTLSLDPKQLKKIKKGQIHTLDVKASLTLNNISKDISTQVSVIGLDGKSLLVNSSAPILLNAKDYQLDAGIEALRAIARLDSISLSVPVTFSLVYQRD